MGIFKCTAIKAGDGWKDTTKIGDVRYAYDYELPSPYGPGQFQTLDYPVSCVTPDQYTFERLGIWATIRVLMPRLRREFRWHRAKLFTMLMSSSFADQDQA